MTAARFIALRAFLRWNRRELGEHLGRSEATLRQWESGVTRIPADVDDWLEALVSWLARNPAPRAKRDVKGTNT